MTLLIGILRTDEVLAELQSTFGDYPTMFRQLFSRVDPSLTFAEYDVRQGLPDVIDCDAYIITGSKHSVYDDLPWIAPLVEFLREVLAQKRKIIGVCFGHQLMAHFFGGRVAPADVGWGVGVRGAAVVNRQPWMAGSPKQIRLLASHKDQVAELPPAAELYLSSDFCPYAGFTLGNQVITVQGHPEFRKEYSEALMKRRRELLGEAVYTAGLDSLSNATDENVLAQWVLNFIEGRSA